jgi:hypothetical protein
MVAMEKCSELVRFGYRVEVNPHAGVEEVGSQAGERDVTTLQEALDSQMRTSVEDVAVDLHPGVNSGQLDDVLHASLARGNDDIRLDEELVPGNRTGQIDSVKRKE